MSEVKLIAILVGAVLLLAAVFFGFRAVYDAGDKAGAARIQTAWDQDKSNIQKVADAAIATATKERDDALEANQVLHDEYETKLANAASDTADFAARLRHAEAIIAADRSPLPAGGTGSGNVSPSEPTSAQQLGQLVALVADFRRECIANDDALDALYESLNRQPHTIH